MNVNFQQLIENLKIQLDQFESEVEQLSVGNKKKKMDKEVKSQFLNAMIFYDSELETKFYF